MKSLVWLPLFWKGLVVSKEVQEEVLCFYLRTHLLALTALGGLLKWSVALQEESWSAQTSSVAVEEALLHLSAEAVPATFQEAIVLLTIFVAVQALSWRWSLTFPTSSSGISQVCLPCTAPSLLESSSVVVVVMSLDHIRGPEFAIHHSMAPWKWSFDSFHLCQQTNLRRTTAQMTLILESHADSTAATVFSEVKQEWVVPVLMASWAVTVEEEATVWKICPSRQVSWLEAED